MICGLDISTSIIGYTVLDKQGQLIELGNVNMTKPKGMDIWQKIDAMQLELANLCNRFKFEYLFVEDVKLNFAAGSSSMFTIIKLARFNGICSFWVRQATNLTPVYIAEGHARKMCGLKMLPKKKSGGKSHKEQAFEQMSEREPFLKWEWEKKRTGRVKDHHYDEMDSYIIARSGFIEFVAS